MLAPWAAIWLLMYKNTLTKRVIVLLGLCALALVSAVQRRQGNNQSIGELMTAIDLKRDQAVIQALAADRDIAGRRDPSTGCTLLLRAAQFNRVELMRRLIEAGADVNAKSTDGRDTPLLTAACHGNADAVRALLDANADPNLSSDTGRTPLMSAAMGGDCEAVRLLLASGADVAARSRAGETAISTADEAGFSDLAKLLRLHGSTMTRR